MVLEVTAYFWFRGAVVPGVPLCAPVVALALPSTGSVTLVVVARVLLIQAEPETVFSA